MRKKYISIQKIGFQSFIPFIHTLNNEFVWKIESEKIEHDPGTSLDSLTTGPLMGITFNSSSMKLFLLS